MRYIIQIMLLIAMTEVLTALPVSQPVAQQAAQAQLVRMDPTNQYTISKSTALQSGTKNIGYVFYLCPTGYIITSGDNELPPVIAYSLHSDLYDNVHTNSLLLDIARNDLELRIDNLKNLPVRLINKHTNDWFNRQVGWTGERFEQWPPEGTTLSGGWIKTQWNQSSPYNALCPMDIVTGNRSLAGCPAVAMAQILHYHATINGTSFTDADDYHHNYGGNNYWIDDSAMLYGFPTFPQLNENLDSLMHHYLYQEDITNTDRASLIYACGVAAHQVFSSAGSGTFSVNQALQAYQRFNFTSAQLISDDIPEFYMQIAQNIKHAMPVHLAIESPDMTSGHNVVVDGYNTDQFYHLNFGWGGAYDGWYLLPDDLPFGLTMIEGAVVDIEPIQYVTVSPDSIYIYGPVVPGQSYTLTVQNIAAVEVSVEDIIFDEEFADMDLENTHEPFPKLLMPGDSTQFILTAHAQGSSNGSTYTTNFRIILDKIGINLPMTYQSPLNNVVEVNQNYPIPIRILQNYPNPFQTSTNIVFELSKAQEVTLSLYDIRGRLMSKELYPFMGQGRHMIQWDSQAVMGQDVPSGVYLYRIIAGSYSAEGKFLLIK